MRGSVLYTESAGLCTVSLQGCSHAVAMRDTVLPMYLKDCSRAVVMVGTVPHSESAGLFTCSNHDGHCDTE